MRQFIRHPVDIPIEVSSGAMPLSGTGHSCNVSLGGLAFFCDCDVEPGSIVDVRIPAVQPPFETQARVAWCTALEGNYELGVEFLSAEDAFRARMVEQVCHIEDYKHMVWRTQGRQLSAGDAAREWIEQYAENFPAVSSEDAS